MKITNMTLEDFFILLEHLPPDTRLAGPHHMPGTASIWVTSDDAGESAVYVVSGETVCRVSGYTVSQEQNCYEELLRIWREDQG